MCVCVCVYVCCCCWLFFFFLGGGNRFSVLCWILIFYCNHKSEQLLGQHFPHGVHTSHTTFPNKQECKQINKNGNKTALEPQVQTANNTSEDSNQSILLSKAKRTRDNMKCGWNEKSLRKNSPAIASVNIITKIAAVADKLALDRLGCRSDLLPAIVPQQSTTFATAGKKATKK